MPYIDRSRCIHHQIFGTYKIPKMGGNILNGYKVYLSSTKYTKTSTKYNKLPQNIPNFHKIYKNYSKYFLNI
jgi:hypothetical protein